MARGLINPGKAFKIANESVHSTIFGSPENIVAILLYLGNDQTVNINGRVFFASGGRIGIYAPSTR